MTVVRYEPWSVVNQLQRDINRALEASLGGGAGEDASNVVTSQWMPTVDIREEPDRFILFADIPGVDPKEVEITMENGVLTLKGARAVEDEQTRASFTRIERARGNFHRRFSLPDTADAGRISARGMHGVIEITIPKHEKVQPRRITVEA